MARGPEAKVKDWLKGQLKKQWPGIWIYMAPGGRFGRKGVPDMLCCINGIFVAIEVKAEGKEPTQFQWDELKLIDEADGISVVMRGKDMVKLSKLINILNKYDKRIKKED